MTHPVTLNLLTNFVDPLRAAFRTNRVFPITLSIIRHFFFFPLNAGSLYCLLGFRPLSQNPARAKNYHWNRDVYKGKYFRFPISRIISYSTSLS